MVEVRLARPDGFDHVIAGVELMVPGTVGPIEQIVLGVRPPSSSQVGITIVSGPGP